MKVEIQTNLRKRVIGDINVDTQTFTKEVKESKHLFRKLDAWSIDGYYFREVLLPGNYKIIIKDKETGITYSIDAKEFNKHGQYYHFNKVEDNKAQIFCPRRNFTILRPVDNSRLC